MAAKTAPHAAVIYAYRVGFGDCFLVRFEYPRGRNRHVLIDFGTTGMPKGVASTWMTEIAEDIAQKCNGKLDAVVATHRHADHISGFARNDKGTGSGDIIRAMQPDVVIQPWTEQPDLAVDASTPRAVRHPSLQSFMAAMGNMHFTAEAVVAQLDQFGRSFPRAISEHIRFIGEDNIANKSAVENLASMGKQSIYTYHGGPSGLGRILPGVKTHVLGPPTLNQTRSITKQRSKDPNEFWHLYLDKLGADNQLMQSGYELFPGHATERGSKLPMSTRWLAQRLKYARGEQMLQIVRMLDKQMNNTSLILLFEAGKKLLFPGDAQLENWQYALSKPEVVTLLRDVDLYKVGHHGSLNATPKSMWNAFTKRGPKSKRNRLKTVLSTMAGKHGSSDTRTEVPRQSLVKELSAHSELHSTEHLAPTALCEEVRIEL